MRWSLENGSESWTKSNLWEILQSSKAKCSWLWTAKAQSKTMEIFRMKALFATFITRSCRIRTNLSLLITFRPSKAKVGIPFWFRKANTSLPTIRTTRVILIQSTKNRIQMSMGRVKAETKAETSNNLNWNLKWWRMKIKYLRMKEKTSWSKFISLKPQIKARKKWFTSSAATSNHFIQTQINSLLETMEGNRLSKSLALWCYQRRTGILAMQHRRVRHPDLMQTNSQGII